MRSLRLSVVSTTLVALLGGPAAPAQDNRAFDAEAYELSRAIQDGDREALSRLQELAESGRAHAQLMLAASYANVMELRDHSESAKWYLAAAVQGQPTAQASIGFSYAHGNGIEKDIGKAIFWLQMAADQGHWLGAGSLGDLYRGERREEPGDLVQAYRWYTVGARILREAGRQDILETMLERRAFIAKSMTMTQIAESESLAAQWVRRDWSELESRLEQLR